MTERADQQDRAIGSLLGLACGDAVGTTLEFKAPGTFDPIDDMVGGGPFRLPAGAWTDDTSMALCLAESILDRGGLDPADQLRRYVMWWKKGYFSSTGRCFDIGGATTAALSRFATTGEITDPHPDEDAAANGSLMRLAPVAIRHWRDPAEAAEMAERSSTTTHPARRPRDACRVLGAITAALVDGSQRPEAVLAADFWQLGDLHPEVEAVARGSWRRKEPPDIRGTGYCVDALEAALWSVGGASDFREAILRAANLGDDADTTAAIAGQIAGARWGASGIPAAWRERVVMAERIRSLALGLFRAGALTDSDEGPRPWAHDELVHAWWTVPGVLAGEYPGHPDAGRATAKVNVLLDAGVRAFVDLTTPEDRLDPYAPLLTEAAGARQLDVAHHSMPIPDNGVIDHDGYDRIVELIRRESARGAVYVHCWGGVGRTGTVIGCLLIDGDDAPADPDLVLDRIAGFRAGTRKDERPCPETGPQRRIIEERGNR